MTDYAAVVLAELRSSGGPSTAAVLAVSTGLSVHTVAKVLKALSCAGLVVATRGRRGGYSPAAREASLLDVVEALEGPLSVTACVAPSSAGCEAASGCPCAGRWDAVNADLRSVLARHSVDTLAAAGGNGKERTR